MCFSYHSYYAPCREYRWKEISAEGSCNQAANEGCEKFLSTKREGVLIISLYGGKYLLFDNE